MIKKSIGAELIQSMNESIKYMRGENNGAIEHKIMVPSNINVPKIRKSMKLTPVEFAKKFGFNYKTLQHWERGDRRPTGPARILLCILEKEPNIVIKYLSSGESVKHLRQ